MTECPTPTFDIKGLSQEKLETAIPWLESSVEESLELELEERKRGDRQQADECRRSAELLQELADELRAALQHEIKGEGR